MYPHKQFNKIMSHRHYFLKRMTKICKQLPRAMEAHHGISSPTWRASNPLWTRPLGYKLASPRLCSVGSPSAVNCWTISEPASESTSGEGGSGIYCSAVLCSYNTCSNLTRTGIQSTYTMLHSDSTIQIIRTTTDTMWYSINNNKILQYDTIQHALY